jgi:hypothetical protein
MTADGIKQVYNQMEKELAELENRNSKFETSDEWEPPSLERIKKRMGMTT